MPNEGLLTGKLSPAQQTSQFCPVCHSALFLVFFTSFFFTVSFSTVGGDQTLLLGRGMLQMKKCKVSEQTEIMPTVCLGEIQNIFHERTRHSKTYDENRLNRYNTMAMTLPLYFVWSGPKISEAVQTAHPAGQKAREVIHQDLSRHYLTRVDWIALGQMWATPVLEVPCPACFPKTFLTY